VNFKKSFEADSDCALHLMLFIFVVCVNNIFSSLQYLMHVDVLPDDSLVIVERPVDAVLQSLPEPLLRKQFGI